MECVCCVAPLLQTEYLVTEVCRCLTGRALRQSEYTSSAATVIHYIIQVSGHYYSTFCIVLHRAQMFEISDWIEYLATIRIDPNPIQLATIQNFHQIPST